MTIHQIYCTHCTYGSSALEQREGELAERVLGYSARAGSMERNELRGYYRQVERFLYYYIPSDSPPDERLKLDAATAPCRMFFSPSIGRLQMLGQVVYRRHDTAGRAGSYFAHVLFGERDAAPWPVLDCLRLWDAPWVIEDAPEHPKRLPTLESLDELRQGRPAAIDDGLLLRFLTTPPGEAFDDPRRVVPERWRSTPRAERAELLIDVVQGFIELGSNRRDSVLLVCEPSLAALVFYGVARLLPAGAVREGVSFSTYEPSPDRLPVALAATSFHAPETIDLKPDAYRRRGYAYNTFLQTRSAAGRPRGTYARLLVETLLAEGWPAVDRLLEDLALSGCGKLEELESLAQTHRLAPRLLDPAGTLDPAVWTRSAVAERYLGAAVERQLSAVEPDGPQLRALIGSPRQMLIVELASRAGAELSPGARFLLRSVPPERLHEVFSSQRIAREAKVETLAFHLSNTSRIPEGCESLWAEGAGTVNRSGAASSPLLSAALARLSQPALVSLQKALPNERGEAFVVALARACPIDPNRKAALVRFMAETVAAFDEPRLIGLLSRSRTDLQALYPKPEPLLAHRLSKLLYELPDRPREFAQRLEALSGWVDHFPDPGLAEHRLAHWRKVHSILQSLADGDEKKSGGFFKSKGKPDYKGLAEALRKAMPEAVYSDDLAGTMKKKRLRELGSQIVGSPNFLPPAVWNTMTRYFEYLDWADGAKKSVGPGRSKTGRPLSKRGGKSKRGPHGGGWFGRWIVLVAIGLGCALGMAILGAIRSATNSSAVAEKKPRQESGARSQESGAIGAEAAAPQQSPGSKENPREPTPSEEPVAAEQAADTKDQAPDGKLDGTNEPMAGDQEAPRHDDGSMPDGEQPSDSPTTSDAPDESEPGDMPDRPVTPTSPSSDDGPLPSAADPGEVPLRAVNVRFPPPDDFKQRE
ncbi:MAG TPA: hypothetical protein VND64_36510, partial [Pirellulales bacterium]|nr:hypothetical protein [Pirellulales bacterium]